MRVDATKRRTERYGDAISQLIDVATGADVTGAYRGGRARLVALAAGLDEAQATTMVPGCPAWRVKDVLAHLTGICADVLAGNIDGVATDPWTAAQVARRRDRALDEIVAEWDELGPQVEALIPAFPVDAARQLTTDLATHEHDVRGALGAPGARDSDAVEIGIHFVVPRFLTAAAETGCPPLRVHGGDTEWVTDGADPSTTLTAERFELLRALTGRRSAAQVRRLGWSDDPEPHLGAFTFGPFTLARTDILE
jgi:uncharacterized protein (TIGR03083 family)